VAAFVLFLLVYTNQIRFGYILVVMFGIGTVQAFDNPCRQSFVVEMVEGREHLMNAIALNSAVFNGARLIGPAVAGMVMAEFGPTWCFLFNAISFVAVIIGLMMMKMDDKPSVVVEKNSESKTGERIKSVIKSIWEGIIFIFNTPKLLYTFIITAIVPTFCMNFNVLVPIFTKDALSLDEKAYGILMSAIGFGALIGALSVATRGKRERAIVYQIIGSLGLSTSLILAGFVPSFITAILVLAMCGFFMIMFNTTCNSVLQFNSPDNMRGRIMSVYSLVFGGLAPVGSMYAGTVAKYFGPQVTFIVSGFIGLAAFLLLLGKRKELS
jgi:predicted MFS family arabinose efflux permease